jgi:hypothetical protein
MNPLPMDPNDLTDGLTEYGWGPGMFPPGIANNEGQTREQDDFGAEYPDLGLDARTGSAEDNYARAVADRRTDPTDQNSARDFEALGNPDRFGGQPPLVQAPTQPNRSQKPEMVEQKLKRQR